MSQSPQEKRNTFSIVALSQQAVASIGVHYGMSLLQTAGKLTAFLKNKLAIDAVVDLSLARHLSLLEAGEEFVERFRQGKLLTISSACPGWVTYAEKTQPSDVLNAISTVRSPQAIIGAIAEQLRPAGDNRQVWLTTIMPCHDKKLEASRPDFVTTHADNVNRKEVDCVMTTGELIDFIKQTSFSLTEAETLPFNKLNSASSPGQFGVAVGSGSGGYAEFILRKAAKELLGITLPDHPIITQKLSKSGDLKTATVSNEDGSKQLKFATAYGFRCLQSILRKVRRGECTYNYIELMACPGGCNNGGGQLPPKSISTEDQRSLKQQNNDHLAKVNATFSEAPVVKDPLVIPGVQKLYRDGLGGHPYSVEAKNQLTMPIQSRKNASGAASLSW